LTDSEVHVRLLVARSLREPPTGGVAAKLAATSGAWSRTPESKNSNNTILLIFFLELIFHSSCLFTSPFLGIVYVFQYFHVILTRFKPTPAKALATARKHRKLSVHASGNAALHTLRTRHSLGKEKCAKRRCASVSGASIAQKFSMEETDGKALPRRKGIRTGYEQRIEELAVSTDLGFG